MRVDIGRTWDGREIADSERATLDLSLRGDTLEIAMEAPFHGDRAPPHPPGSTPGLWEYEVLELFLLGEDQRYTELEFGPFGHYLLLQLQGERQVVRQGMEIHFEVERDPLRWQGLARVPLALLPTPVALNAYAIYGTGESRTWLAHVPVPGSAPDFHQLAHFRPVRWPYSFSGKVTTP